MILGTSSENYLETMYLLFIEKSVIRSVDIAEKLNVSRASVNKAIGVLKSDNFLTHEHYGEIKLTEKGLNVAKEILERHRIIKKFLIHVLNVNEVNAEEDACKMEHILSKETLIAIKNYKKYS